MYLLTAVPVKFLRAAVWIEALDLKDVTLLGWSMGASIIWSYIDLFGNEYLAKIILVDQSPRQYFTPKWKAI